MLGMVEPYFPESSHVSFPGLEGAKDRRFGRSLVKVISS
jgi:hypothetical protein